MLHGLFCSCGEWGLLSNCGAGASHCGGFSCFGSWVLEHRLNSCGTWGLVAPLTCGIFPDQGSLAGGFFTTEPRGKRLLSTLLLRSEIFHNVNFLRFCFKSWHTVPSPISESKMAPVRSAGTEKSLPNHYWGRVEFRGHGPMERDEEWVPKVRQAGLSHMSTSPGGSGLVYSETGDPSSYSHRRLALEGSSWCQWMVQPGQRVSKDWAGPSHLWNASLTWLLIIHCVGLEFHLIKPTIVWPPKFERGVGGEELCMLPVESICLFYKLGIRISNFLNIYGIHLKQDLINIPFLNQAN